MQKHVSAAARSMAGRDACADHMQGRSREPMSDPDSTNQIFDLAVGLDTLALGVSPSESLAMLGAVMAQSLGLAMYSAVSTQQQAGIVRNAAVTMTCTTLMSWPVDGPNTPVMGAAPGQPGPVKPEPDRAAATASAVSAAPGPDGAATSGRTGSVVDAINQIQRAVMSPEVVIASGAGKAYQSVAHSAALAVQDAAEALRGMSIVATVASGVAMARFLTEGDPKYLAGITAAQDMVKLATEDFTRISAAAAEALKGFPSS
jgi:Killing trait